MSNEDYRSNQDQNREQAAFDEDAFYRSSAPAAEDISGIVENLSKPRSMLYSILSLVCAIVSVLICCCGGWFGLGLGALAIAFSVIARRHLGYFDGMAIAGLVLGICGVLFGAAMAVVGILIDNGTLDAFLEELIREMESEVEPSIPENIA